MYNSNDKLRIYSTDRIEKTDYYTADDGWMICEKECVPNWSAIAYLTGNEISKTKDVAVGVIDCYQGESDATIEEGLVYCDELCYRSSWK